MTEEHGQHDAAQAAAEPPRPAYEPFALRLRKRTRLNALDGGLKRKLPKPVYLAMLRSYHGARTLTRRNPGRGCLLPDFVIIGAAKAGTTSVYAWLCSHPFVRRARVKEVHYFSFYNYRGTDWYRHHFPHASEAREFAATHGRPLITGEASPSYMIDPEVPARMAKLLPDVKLIVCLRDPVARAYSQFHMRRDEGQEVLEDFLTACALEDPALDGGRAHSGAAPEVAEIDRTYLVRSRYAENLEPWFQTFPRERFHFIEMQDLNRDPQGQMDLLHEFLGLPAHTYAELEVRFASSYEPLVPEAAGVLREYFRPHNERLYELLGQDYRWPR